MVDSLSERKVNDGRDKTETKVDYNNIVSPERKPKCYY